MPTLAPTDATLVLKEVQLGLGITGGTMENIPYLEQNPKGCLGTGVGVH